MAIKKLDDGRYEVDIPLLDVTENASVGSLIRKAKLSLSKNTRCTTTTIKNGYQNQQTNDVCRN